MNSLQACKRATFHTASNENEHYQQCQTHAAETARINNMTQTKLAISVVLTFLCTGCVYIDTERLPLYRKAMNTPGPARPKLFYAEYVPNELLPAMVPYAVITASTDSATRAECASQIWSIAADYRADVVLIQDAKTDFAGITSAYMGFGITHSVANYKRSYRAVCYRVVPSHLGFILNDRGMIVARDASIGQDFPLQEGDTPLSINGVPISNHHQSSYYRLLLGAKPGDEFKSVWLRPGVGRMEGTARAIENSKEYLTWEDSIDW